MSLLAIPDILELFAETLTADYKYSPRNSDNLPKAIQMQLSKKQNNFSQCFLTLVKSKSIFGHFQKNRWP